MPEQQRNDGLIPGSIARKLLVSANWAILCQVNFGTRAESL